MHFSKESICAYCNFVIYSAKNATKANVATLMAMIMIDFLFMACETLVKVS